MSLENVAVMKRSLEVFQAAGLDAWLETFVAPDAVFVQGASVAPDAQTWVGWDGWRAVVTAWSEEFEEWGVDFHEARSIPEGRLRNGSISAPRWSTAG